MTDSKTVRGGFVPRGFKSLPLRSISRHPLPSGFRLGDGRASATDDGLGEAGRRHRVAPHTFDPRATEHRFALVPQWDERHVLAEPQPLGLAVEAQPFVAVDLRPRPVDDLPNVIRGVGWAKNAPSIPSGSG